MNSLQRAQNFCQIYDGKVSSVDVQLDTIAKKNIDTNREKFVPTVKTIIFCGRQNISLRSHRNEKGSIVDRSNEECEINEGNFRALLHFRIDAGDVCLENHLKNAPKNATFISSVTQNDIIHCCGDVILEKVIEKVKKANWFSVLADETTDAGHSEQMSISVRYVDFESKSVREDFIRFVKVADLTGETLGRTIASTLQKSGLSLSNLRGQGYDGASNMSGNFKGSQAYISELQPIAVYVHCYSHCLNLALVKACDVPTIRNMMEVVEQTTNFIRDSPKRL